MKTAFILLLLPFTLLFSTPCHAQQLTKGQVDSLLNGTWKDDSSGRVLRFDCHRKDTIVTYGILDPKMKWFTSFKLTVKCHLPCDCALPDSGLFFMAEIDYTNDPRKTTRLGYNFKVMGITKNKLSLYLMQKGHYLYHCNTFTYTKVK